jgi:hypothetical protein
MNTRIHQALDGNIDRHRLNAIEQEELRQAEADIDAVLRAIPEHPLPDLAPAVLARIRHEAVRHTRPVVVAAAAPMRRQESSILSWLWTPRAVSIGFRPAYALAAGLLLAVLVAGPALRPVSSTSAGTPQVFTRFVLQVPNANTVALAGDFTGWKPSFTLTQTGPGLWTVVVPLEPGIHTYAFVIDGERWVADPSAPSVDDGFGGSNSRVAVLTPDARKL